MLNRISSYCMLPFLAQAYRNALNIGGDGVDEQTAQVYKFFGGFESNMSMVLSVWEQSVIVSSSETQTEFHGQLYLSVVGATDQTFYDMGFCFRPIQAGQSEVLDSSEKFDCLDTRFLYSTEDLANPDAPGYTQKFIGFDLFGPGLDVSTMLPLDLVSDFLDSHIDTSSTDRSGTWKINTESSYKECKAEGVCIFSVQFSRDMIVDDQEDYNIVKGSNTQYEAYTYAAQYDDFGTVRTASMYEVSDIQNIYLENVALI